MVGHNKGKVIFIVYLCNSSHNGNMPYTKMSDTYPLSIGFLEQISLFVTNKP